MRAQRRDLRQREVDEDDAALDDVHAEVGVDAGEDEAGDEGGQQQLEDGHDCPPSAATSASTLVSKSAK